MSDLISRQAMKNMITNHWSDFSNATNYRTALACVDAVPTVTEIIRCKDCKHFEYDHFENVNGIPLIIAHEICMRWCDGVKTSEDGYCFLAERREVTE